MRTVDDTTGRNGQGKMATDLLQYRFTGSRYCYLNELTYLIWHTRCRGLLTREKQRMALCICSEQILIMEVLRLL